MGDGKKKRWYFGIGGFGLGVLLMAVVWLCAGVKAETMAAADTGSAGRTEPVSNGMPIQAEAVSYEDFGDREAEWNEPDPEEPLAAAGAWDKNAVYLGGDTVTYQGKKYRAKWWTQGETPGKSEVWEEIGAADTEVSLPEEEEEEETVDEGKKNRKPGDFKVVGYYPSWTADGLDYVNCDVLTHVCYAFAIPKADGTLRPLENPDTARALIKKAHKKGVLVLLSVGGWSYNDVPLEGVFMEATATKAKRKKLADSIVAMCEKYGFDGADMDWEHPRADGTSKKQYEALMLSLSKRLHKKDKLLTAAVLSGATADGNIYYDAAAHTDAVLEAVDFINVMAYDGGEGERHSSYQFAKDCGKYWKKTRGLPAEKVVLGVPFYARPGWADYGTLVESVPGAHKKDHVTYNGTEVWYNGTKTIAKKTKYARENLGGIMIWDLTKDSKKKSRSLLETIRKNL